MGLDLAVGGGHEGIHKRYSPLRNVRARRETKRKRSIYCGDQRAKEALEGTFCDLTETAEAFLEDAAPSRCDVREAVRAVSEVRDGGLDPPEGCRPVSAWVWVVPEPEPGREVGWDWGLAPRVVPDPGLDEGCDGGLDPPEGYRPVLAWAELEPGLDVGWDWGRAPRVVPDSGLDECCDGGRDPLGGTVPDPGLEDPDPGRDPDGSWEVLRSGRAVSSGSR